MLTLEEVIADFGRNKVFDPSLPNENVLDIYSGGIRQKGGEVPALYLTQDLAVQAFANALPDVVMRPGGPDRDTKQHYFWLERPTIETYQITAMDYGSRSHRVAGDRYTVASRLVIQ